GRLSCSDPGDPRAFCCGGSIQDLFPNPSGKGMRSVGSTTARLATRGGVRSIGSYDTPLFLTLPRRKSVEFQLCPPGFPFFPRMSGEEAGNGWVWSSAESLWFGHEARARSAVTAADLARALSSALSSPSPAVGGRRVMRDDLSREEVV